jgi:hypothetical protein
MQSIQWSISWGCSHVKTLCFSQLFSIRNYGKELRQNVIIQSAVTCVRFVLSVSIISNFTCLSVRPSVASSFFLRWAVENTGKIKRWCSGGANIEEIVHFAATCRGSSPSQFFTCYFAWKKRIVIVTTMGSLLEYWGNPKISSAVARTPGKSHNIFWYCTNMVENTNYLMSLLRKGRTTIISCRPYITESNVDILGREKTEGNKSTKCIIIRKNGGKGDVLIWRRGREEGRGTRMTAGWTKTGK